MKAYPTSVRLPHDVHARLARQARSNHRSLHGEMLAIMKEAVGIAPRRVVIRCAKADDGDGLAAIVKAVQDRVGTLGEVRTEFVIETVSV